MFTNPDNGGHALCAVADKTSSQISPEVGNLDLSVALF